ncbi:hypothetical protein AYO40_01430, partial [Planctomycetaceae bacterium SCGC AG-212-D15]
MNAWLNSAALILCIGTSVAAADWPQFLGPQRNGSSPETGLLAQWDAKGPKVVWKVPGGPGHAQVAVVGGRAYTLVERGGDEVVLALDAATGKEIWSKRFGRGSSPSSTPAVAADRLYVQSASGPLYCLETDSGKVIWERNLPKGHRVPYAQGMMVSPILEGNLVLTVVGGAWNRTTGEPVWTNAEKTGGFEFSSPVVVRVGRKSQAVFVTGTQLVAVQPDDGKVLWRYPWTHNEGDAATPVVIDGQIFVSSGGCALLTPAASGEPRVLWKEDRTMDNYWATAVCDGKYLYGISGMHATNPSLNCVELSNGRLVWSRKAFGWANLTLADRHLYILTVKGELVVAAATWKGYEEKGRATVL